MIADLMLELFRGRPDVIAVAAGTGFGPHRMGDKPLTADVLNTRHLAGVRCLGFYLVHPGNTVWCSCVDFDNKDHAPDPEWQDKATKLADWLSNVGLSPLVEVSASGNGAHVWLFFEEPTPAWVVRGFWKAAESKTGITFKEVYPRQDSVKEDGIGNLVRFPLWGMSRFVDHENEWETVEPEAAMRAAKRTSAAELKELAYSLGCPLNEPFWAKPQDGKAPYTETGLPPRVADRLNKKQSLLARRWNGDMSDLRDASRSALVQSIACELVRQYVPTPEVEAAIRYWCVENSYEGKGNRPDWIERTVGKAYEFVLQRIESNSANATDLKAACLAFIDQLEKGTSGHIGSGIVSLDQSIDGVAPGEMCVIAARPSHGKSALAIQWIDSASKAGMKSLLISEEMSATNIGKRVLLGISSVGQDGWDKNSAPQLRLDTEKHFADRVPPFIVENSSTIDRCEDVIEQFVGVHGVGLVAVDYLQLLGARGGKRYEEVTEISRRLKQVAGRCGVGLLVLSQMNREVESRESHKPKLSDLRESGQIEQDADLVIFVEYPCRYNPEPPQGMTPDAWKKKYVMYIGKRRDGPIRQDVIETTFDTAKQRIGGWPFRDFTDDEFDVRTSPFRKDFE